MERMRVVATPENPCPSPQRKAFFGKCMVVVKGNGSVTAKSPMLQSDVIEFTVKN
jgi:beta-galactosidase